MGLIAKLGTRKRVGDLSATVGAWSRPTDSEAFGLEPGQLVTAAIHAAVLGTPVAKARSTWIDEKGKHSTAEIASSTTSSVLRSQGGLKLGDRVSLGTPDPAMRFISDWEVAVRCMEGNAVLSVPSYRTQDDQIPHKDILDRVRARVASALLDGPYITRQPGPPNFDVLVSPAILTNNSSVFSKDLLSPPPDRLSGGGCSISLPAGCLPALTVAIDATRLPQLAPVGPYVRVLDLGGGRSAGGRLLLCAHEGDDHLAVEIMSSPSARIGPGGHARTVRAVLCTLHSLSVRVRDSLPAAAAVIDAFVDECEAEVAQPDRSKRFVPLWDKDTPAPAMSVGPGATVPVGIVFRTEADRLLDLLITAQRWLLVRQRTWSKGLRQSTQEKNRFYTARRPAILSDSESILPFLRYGDLPDTDVAGTISTMGDLAWFWELGLRSRPSQAGRSGSLLVDALSIADGYLAYGAEMASAFQAFCWLLRSLDPQAEIDTITVTIT